MKKYLQKSYTLFFIIYMFFLSSTINFAMNGLMEQLNINTNTNMVDEYQKSKYFCSMFFFKTEHFFFGNTPMEY